MSAKKQTGGYAAQGAGLGVGRVPRKSSPHLPSASMTEQEDEARWEQLLAAPESQAVLENMAEEALEEDQAGLTKDLVICSGPNDLVLDRRSHRV